MQTSEPRRRFVIALSDPRTGHVRFVTASWEPHERTAAKLQSRARPAGDPRDHAHPTTHWMRELSLKGLTPDITECEEIIVHSEMRDMVTHWARAYTEQGEPVLNPEGDWADKYSSTAYTEELAMEIVARYAAGETVNAICRDPAMPSRWAIYDWRRAHPEFARAMRAAQEAHADHLVDSTLELADNAGGEDVPAAKLRILSRQWIAARISPRYGDQGTKATEAETTGALSAAAPPPLPAELEEQLRRHISAQIQGQEIGDDDAPIEVAPALPASAPEDEPEELDSDELTEF